MSRTPRILAVLILCLSVAILSGCSGRYGKNRCADFSDIFQVGAGITAENPYTGAWPPALGLHIQATEFINLGAVHFTGYAAELDGRGAFAGPESRTRFGLGPIQVLRINQDYDHGYENYFKKEYADWMRRMNTERMRWRETPAKQLEYSYWADRLYIGAPIMHRGWQYWENFNIEAAICEPFITHFGITLRLGFDPSEISDWLLGFATIDFKNDDLTTNEYQAMMNGSDVIEGRN
ncbi:MAG: hypothetical protein ACOC2L_02845 [Candidatus Sumerlaeota bacterium]